MNIKYAYTFFTFLILGIVSITFLNSSAKGDAPINSIIENPKHNTWIQTDQAFHALAVEFLEGQDHADIYLPNSEIPVHIEIDPEDDSERFSTLAFSENAQRFMVESNGSVNIHLYHQQKRNPFLLAGALNVGGVKVISRQEWGADESIRYDYRSEEDIQKTDDDSLTSKQQQCQSLIEKYPEEYTYSRVVSSEQGNKLLWPRQYSKKVKKIVIHHTAESDKSKEIPGSDKIRSIYYYHAKTRGWGDIGYQFVIDQDGNVYEGRAGGDYVVGGHAYCSNINTVGVALMGNFERTQPSKGQIAALTRLLKGLSQKYSLDLTSENVFHGTKGPALLGHRDVKSTACPGHNFYKLLPVFRKHFSVADINFGISSKSETLTPASSFSAKLSEDAQMVSIPAMSSKKITLTYKNTGKVSWKKGTWLYAGDNDNDNFWAESIILDRNYVAADLQEFEVKPGESGHFDITLKTGIQSGVHTLELVPIINSERKLDSASVLLAVEIPETNIEYKFIRAEHPISPLYYGQHREAKVLLKNTGNTTWKRSGDFAITLASPNNTSSPFANEKTPTTLAWMEQNEIKPGEIASFIFDVFAGFDKGEKDMPFIPRVGADHFLNDSGMKFSFNVKKPNYKTQILYDNSSLIFTPGETKIIKLGLKNLSDVDWEENQISLKVVKANGLSFQQSDFYFPDFIPKSDSGFINIAIIAPVESGNYSAKLQVLANEKKFSDTRWLYLPIEVSNAQNSGEITHLSKKSFSLGAKEESEEITLRVKNTGNITWEKSGGNIPRLINKRGESKLVARSWQSDSIVSFMENGNVEPGQVATFHFKIQKNIDGNIKESFMLNLKSFGDIPGTEFILVVKSSKNNSKIPNNLDNTVVKTQEKNIEKTRLNFKDKNIDSRLRGNNNAVDLNTKGLSFKEKLKLRKEAYYESLKDFKNKILEKRRKSSLSPQLSPSSQSGHLENDNHSDQSTICHSREGGNPSTYTDSSLLKVDSCNPNSNNKIRILLSFPESSANVLTDSLAKIYVDKKLFKVLRKGDSMWTRKDHNNMIVSVNGQKKNGKQIRVITKEHLTLFNWHRPPAWNPNINDNTFSDTLEFRIEDGKMIVINELSMEAYLHGMAEVPELEPYEKHKAMAVLARSYARHYTETSYKKFPGKPYDGSDSPAVFQKYLGHNYTLRSPNWQKALKETEDEVITYNDNILRTAYFSCSNGKTKTPEAAGWFNDYYQKDVLEVYKSVDDTHGKDLERYRKRSCGHGVGLSGSGATAMAKSGNPYKDILKYYYQNVEIEKL
jgi:hypothetical protein